MNLSAGRVFLAVLAFVIPGAAIYVKFSRNGIGSGQALLWAAGVGLVSAALSLWIVARDGANEKTRRD